MCRSRARACACVYVHAARGILSAVLFMSHTRAYANTHTHLLHSMAGKMGSGGGGGVERKALSARSVPVEAGRPEHGRGGVGGGYRPT